MKANTPDQPIFFRPLDDFIDIIPRQTDSQSLANHRLIDSYLNHYSLNLDTLDHCEAHEIWQSTIAGFRIVEQRWQPQHHNGEHLILCHGYFDHTALYGKVIRWALKQGYCLHSFDLPGHGLSSGERASINSFDEYSRILTAIIDREQYSAYTCIGQSTGCAVILNAVLNKDIPATSQESTAVEKPPEHIILLAPLVRSIHWQALRWPYLLLNSFIPSIKRTFAESSHDKDFNQFLHNHDPLQPTQLPLAWLGAMDEWIEKVQALKPNPQLRCTIIQGTGDNTVDYDYNLRQIQRCLPNTHIDYIDDAFHHLANESDEYWQQVKQALDNSINPPQ